MKYKIASTYIAIFWLAVFIVGFWIFKILMQASPVPEFAAGLVGGAVYAIVMREIYSVVVESIKDCANEWRDPDHSKVDQ